MENNDLNLGVMINLKTPDHFLLCKESLTRIGIANIKEKKLYQSANILHKKGKYYIMHFKEMFILDGKSSTITDDDYARRNLIVHLLEDWNLVEPVNFDYRDNIAPLNSVKILSHSEKKEWNLIPKYSLGLKHN